VVEVGGVANSGKTFLCCGIGANGIKDANRQGLCSLSCVAGEGSILQYHLRSVGEGRGRVGGSKGGVSRAILGEIGLVTGTISIIKYSSLPSTSGPVKVGPSDSGIFIVRDTGRGVGNNIVYAD